jgi:hypothetical protein
VFWCQHQRQQHFGILFPFSRKRTELGELRAGLRGWLDPEALGAMFPPDIPAGFHSSYLRRRGQAHLETHNEMLETVIGAWRRAMDRDGYRVSRFGFRPRAVSWSSVLSCWGSSDDDRSLAPFFPLSPLLFLFSDAVPILKKARSFVSPPRSPENHGYCPTLSSPILSFSPLLFASGHSAPST